MALASFLVGIPSVMMIAKFSALDRSPLRPNISLRVLAKASAVFVHPSGYWSSKPRIAFTRSSLEL